MLIVVLALWLIGISLVLRFFSVASEPRCPACDGEQLYVQRDFNQKAGLAIVIVGAALAPFTPYYASLVVAVLVDAALYALLPEITVCYRCHAHLRGFRRNPKHHPFDLHLAEQYEIRR